MSIVLKVAMRSMDKRESNPPKKYYPHLITLGQCVHLIHLEQKPKDPSLFSVDDIKNMIQNITDVVKEQLKERPLVDIEGLGVASLSLRPESLGLKKYITIKTVESPNICLMTNKDSDVSKSACVDEMADLLSMGD